MAPWNSSEIRATQHMDYRPSRCRCGSVVQPYQPFCPRCSRAQSLFYSGLERLHEANLDELLRYHRRQVDDSPYDYHRIFNLAGAHLLRGEYEPARDLYLRVIQLKPEFADAHLNLGGVLAHLGQKDDAVRELKRFIQLDLHSPKVERALRAISSIKNIPYEDAAQETGIVKNLKKSPARGKVKSTPPPPKTKTRIRGIEVRLPPAQKGKNKRAFGPIDAFLIVLVLIIAAAWFAFPGQSRSALNGALAELEGRYEFIVLNGELNPDTGEVEPVQETAVEEVQAPAIINAEPMTSSYYPLSVGNRWTYSLYDTRDPNGGGTRLTVSTQTVEVTSLIDSIRGIFRLMNGAINIYLLEKNTGVYSINNPNSSLQNLITQIPYPPVIGRTHTDGGQTCTVVGEEIIQTQAGLVKAIKIHYTLREPSGTEWYAWYGQGIGLVKYIGGGRDGMYNVRELRSYELK